MSRPEIKPCRCGNRRPSLIHRGGRFYVHCTICADSGNAGSSEAGAVRDWNDRTKGEMR